jgi:hypothetical protein
MEAPIPGLALFFSFPHLSLILILFFQSHIVLHGQPA